MNPNVTLPHGLLNRLQPVALMTLMTASAILLAACDKSASTDGAPANASSAAAPSASEAQPKESSGAPDDEKYNAKLNAYTEAYNKLIGSFGLPETRKSYFDKEIAQKTAKADIFISQGWLDQALAAFKKGRALPPAGLDELDTSADQLISALEKLTAQLKELDLYYKAKAYKEDNLAKGKEQDPIVRASFDAGTSAMEKFNEVLTREHKKRDAALLAQLKASGNLRAYSIKLGLQQAQEIINLFKDEDDVKNPEKYKQGDALVAELEKTLAEQRKLHDAMQSKDANFMNHESVTDNLTSLVGAYRQLKESKRGNDFNQMVNKYNSAVGAANNINE